MSRQSPPANDGPLPAERTSGRAKALIMGAAMLGLFLAAMDQTVVGTAMPRVIAELRGLELYSWVFTAYMLTSTIAVPIVGKLSDLYGRKPFFIAGVVIFLLGSALSGMSQTMTQLILFRGLQGVGGGFLFANTFAVIGDLFAPGERAKYAGLMSGVFGLASVIGPLVGGTLTDHLNWRWVFYVNLPLGLVTIPVLAFVLPSFAGGRGERKIDYLGAMTLAGGLAPLLLALSWGGREYPWASTQILGLFAASAVVLLAFLWVESRAAEPIIPLALFRNDIFAVSMLVTFITGVGLFANSMLIPLFMQGVRGQSATASGLLLTPMTLGIVSGSTIAGQFISRFGRYRTVTMAGLVVVTGAMFLLSLLHRDERYVTLAANMFMAGFGMGFTIPTLVVAAQNAVPYDVLGIVTSLVQFARSVGGTIGLALLGTLMANNLSADLNRLPPSIVESTPAPLIERLRDDPGVIASPQGLAQLQQNAAGFGVDITALLDALRDALTDAIAADYRIAVFILASALVATAFLREVPLRRTYAPAPLEGVPAFDSPDGAAEPGAAATGARSGGREPLAH
jgi:EmrB/QacA subfamily drug resistance transporter